jgi:hypothetical protein
MFKSKFSLLWVALMAILVSCDASELYTVPEPRIEVVSSIKQMTSYDRPSILVVVENVGTGIAYNVSVDIQAKDAQGVIIDTAKAFPGDLGDIAPSVKAQDEAVFFDLRTHSDYAELTYTIDWLDRK